MAVIIAIVINISCIEPKERKMYTVNRISHPVHPDGRWDKAPWTDIPSVYIEQFMGEEPVHKPVVESKITYDQDAVYVIFLVKDRYVRAIANHYQGEVYKDSCVEFFFTPGEDISIGYFNLEVNCGGTALFQFQKIPRKDPVKVSTEDFEKIRIAHSLPEIIDPEIKDTVSWTLEYRIPVEILSHYCQVIPPAYGVQWKANLYKCADSSSHPHWLTWSKVDAPKPDFHRPEFFGTLEFK